MTITPISHIFKKASEIKSKNERIEYLRQNYSPLMRDMIQGAYNPNVEFIIPAGRIAYTPLSQARGTLGDKLHREMINGKLKYYVKGGGAENMDKKKLLNKFVNLLESLEPDDAEMLMYIKDKTLPYPYLTYKFMNEVFPNMLPDNGEEEWEKRRMERN